MENKKLIIDGHKLEWHGIRLREWYKNGDCAPIYLEIGLTNICNHSCVFCGFDYARGTDILDTKVLTNNLRIMGEYGVKAICYAGAGEPLLHKDFSKIVKETKENGIDVAFSTNIVLLNRERAQKILPYTSWIRLSLDSATPKTHVKIHNPRCDDKEADFKKIISNLEDLVNIKNKNNYNTTLGAQFLLLDENAHELLDAAKLCKEIGLDLFQVKPYSKHPPSINNIDVDYNKFNHLEEEVNSLSTPDFKVVFRSNRIKRIKTEKDYPNCLSLSFWAMINERGDVVPCDMFYNSQDSYGNLYEQTFKEIWEGSKRKRLLQQIKDRGLKDCKEGCRGDLINIFLHKTINEGIKNLEDKEDECPKDVNFI